MQRSAQQPGGRPRKAVVLRPLTRWVILFSLVLLAFIGTVTALNRTLFSASGFTAAYLDTLARHDVEGALGFPGVASNTSAAPGSVASVRATGGSAELLTPAALAEISGIRLVSDTETANGQHTLEYRYFFGHVMAQSTFVIEPSNPHLGFFSGWRFVHSPLGTLTVTPQHGTDFVANGVALSPAGAAGVAHEYRVLVPAAVTLSYSSTYLVAAPATVVVAQSATPVTATVNIQANAAFSTAISAELTRYLTACVTQKVLLPTGCPMGKQISDRLQGAPIWTMVKYPAVTIQPGAAANTWEMPQSPATAHLLVRVRSIFDGSLSTVSVDVPFSVQYLISFGADGAPTITAQ